MKKITILLLAFMLCLSACSTSDSGNEEGTYTPGTYTGEAEGFQGNVVATVTVDANSITAIEIDESQNSNQLLSDTQRAEIAQAMIDAQTPLVSEYPVRPLPAMRLLKR